MRVRWDQASANRYWDWWAMEMLKTGVSYEYIAWRLNEYFPDKRDRFYVLDIVRFAGRAAKSEAYCPTRKPADVVNLPDRPRLPPK